MASTGDQKPRTGVEMQLNENPRAINVAQFAVARAAEINTMMKAIATMGSMRCTFQKLPRHLQRRAMSHNVKRLPRRLRESARQESSKQAKAKQQKGAPQQKKSRHHRRRPSNLRSEYVKRQGKNRWLETHIWHAKRFKMIERWGWKIPLHPSDKSARATYRATARHCVMSDVSYYQVVELHGEEGHMLTALEHLTSPELGLTIAARAYLAGTRHGEVILFKKDRYPYGALGPVNFLWQWASPDGDTNEMAVEEESMDVGGSERRMGIYKRMRRLWMWVHPASKNEIFTELCAVCQPDCVSVMLLEDEVLRFCLQGPLAHPILLDALQVATVTMDTKMEEEGDDDSPGLHWWEQYYKNPSTKKIYEKQAATWNGLCSVQSATELAPNSVVSLIVRDPRALLPKKRTKVMVDLDNLTDLSNHTAHGFQPEIASSPLWLKEIRQAVEVEQKPQHELNQLRSDLLVPGTDLDLGRKESRVPVMLLQQAGTRQHVGQTVHDASQEGMLGYGGGWDVVLPRKWGMAFWVALVYRGARASGLRESAKVALHCSLPLFPDDFPDSKSGSDLADAVNEELARTYARKPPAKRPNHGKLGIIAPFRSPWCKLISEWVSKENSDATDSYDSMAPGVDSEWYVLRNKEKLKMLRELVQYWSKKMKRTKHGRKDLHKAAEGETETNQTAHRNGKQNAVTLPNVESQIEKLVPACSRSLVWVGLKMLSRGCPGQFAVICLPNAADLAELGKNPNYGGPLEPVHKEFNYKRCKKGKKGKNAKKERKSEETASELSSVTENNKNTVENMTSATKTTERSADELNSKIEPKLLKSCTKCIMGFVTNGGHAFSCGKGMAVGFCSMLGLVKLFRDSAMGRRLVVLVRDSQSLQYRFAYIYVPH